MSGKKLRDYYKMLLEKIVRIFTKDQSYVYL